MKSEAKKMGSLLDPSQETSRNPRTKLLGNQLTRFTIPNNFISVNMKLPDLLVKITYVCETCGRKITLFKPSTQHESSLFEAGWEYVDKELCFCPDHRSDDYTIVCQGCNDYVDVRAKNSEELSEKMHKIGWLKHEEGWVCEQECVLKALSEEERFQHELAMNGDETMTYEREM